MRMGSIEWATPAPLWADMGGLGTAVEFRQPQLVKLTTDDFLPFFLDAMAGRIPAETAVGFLADPAHGFADPEDTVDATLKLYHPAHSRYYLAIGSLICRQLGLPDRSVRRQNGERTSFVIRRQVIVDGVRQEQGWVDEGPLRGWQPLVDGNGSPVKVRGDEERLPMHPVNAQLRPCCNGNNGNGASLASPFAALAGDERTLYYGYIPVGNRAKYAERRPVAAGTPAQAMADFEQDVRQASTREKDYDFRMDEVTTRVVEPWHGLFVSTAYEVDRLQGEAEVRAPIVALYLILDLADWLNRYIPEVFGAITSHTALPAGKRKEFYDELKQIVILRQAGGVGGWVNISLADAIDLLAPKLELVRGTGTEPADHYDIRTPTFPLGAAPEDYLQVLPVPGEFHDKLKAALAETQAPAEIPGEIVDLLKDQVTQEPPDAAVTAEAAYFLRLVYEYPPCSPIVSAESKPFAFARYFDPDAPARHIRIQLPSVAMKDLRKYKRGVGLEMSPELRDIMNRVQKSMLDGEGLSGDSGGWELAMICSFSLQIIFLVAFIVMFIFLIAFNFIFWWLPFLKICFPIPKKA